MALIDLDALIAAARAERREFSESYIRVHNHGFAIEAAAYAIREKALLDARAAIVGKVEPGFAFDASMAGLR